MLSRIGLRATLLGLFVGALCASPAVAAPTVDGEFPVAGGLETNNKLTTGPDGNVWVTLSGTDDVARITPGGTVDEFDLGVTGASGIAAGPQGEGELWITHENGVTSFLPADPEGTKDTTAIAAIATFHSIALGPDGNLWVATVDNLVRVPPADPGDFDVFPVTELSPRDIDVAGSLLAVADFNDRILTATTAGVPVTSDIPLTGGSQGVAGGLDGQFAFSQQENDPREVGLFTPPGPALTTPFPGDDPFGVAFGADRAYWFAESNGDRLLRLSADNKVTSLPGFAAKSVPRQIAAGPGNTLWVTLVDAEKVARVSGVFPEAEPICFCGLERKLRTRIVKGPKRKVKIGGRRALVRFRFRSPDAGTKFECSLRRVSKKGGQPPKPRFRACKPPKIYALRPGKYRFWVRAVLGDEFDRTPAKRTFFVIRKR